MGKGMIEQRVGRRRVEKSCRMKTGALPLMPRAVPVNSMSCAIVAGMPGPEAPVTSPVSVSPPVGP